MAKYNVTLMFIEEYKIEGVEAEGWIEAEKKALEIYKKDNPEPISFTYWDCEIDDLDIEDID